MLHQTKDLLNELLQTEQQIILEPQRSDLISIKLLLIETLITSLTYDLNSQSVNRLRGLEKGVILTMMQRVYTQESDTVPPFDFHTQSAAKCFKLLLATLLHRHMELDRRIQPRIEGSTKTA